MTITNGYTTRALAKAYCRIPANDVSDDAMLDALVEAASRQIDRYTGRRFWQDPTVVDRQYHADDGATVYVDEISTASGLIVKVDADDDGTYETTLTVSTDFVLYPLNAADDSRPYDLLRVPSSSSYRFPTCSRPGVQVTAKFGWVTAPDDIALACVLQTQHLYKAKDAAGGIVQVGLEGLPIRMSVMHPQARALLADYVREPR